MQHCPKTKVNEKMSEEMNVEPTSVQEEGVSETKLDVAPNTEIQIPTLEESQELARVIQGSETKRQRTQKQIDGFAKCREVRRKNVEALKKKREEAAANGTLEAFNREVKAMKEAKKQEREAKKRASAEKKMGAKSVQFETASVGSCKSDDGGYESDYGNSAWLQPAKSVMPKPPSDPRRRKGAVHESLESQNQIWNRREESTARALPRDDSEGYAAPGGVQVVKINRKYMCVSDKPETSQHNSQISLLFL
jgi:hypothetical protein